MPSTMIRAEPRAFSTGLLDVNCTGKSMRLEYLVFASRIGYLVYAVMFYAYDASRHAQRMGTRCYDVQEISKRK